MSVFFRPALRAIALSTVFAGAASAQAAAKACEVDEGRPSQLGRATLAIQVASGTQDPAAAAKQLSNAVKLVTDNGEKMSNQVGRNLVLGKALVLWSTQPNIELVTKRGPLGYTTNPEGTIDLVAAIDTAFKVVESANPECISETSRWRSQKAWVALVNKAIERLGADDLDAAEEAAANAIKLNPYGPYGYVIMASVKSKRNQGTEAFKLYRQSVELAAKDTIYDDIRRQSLIYLGNLAADSAEVAEGAGRKPYVDEAKAAFEKVIADPKAEELKVNARAGMCRVAIVSGDTAALRQNYKENLANPAGFEYAELMNAGVCMARAEMTPEATTLFKAAYEKNPYHRDALSNLAIMHLRNDNHDLAAPLAARLVEVEPNNPDNMQLAVLSYAGIAKRSRDTRMAANKAAAPAKGATKGKAPAAATKAPAGPKLTAAQIDSLFEHEKAYTDSAVAMNDRKEKLELKVTLSDFTTTDERATVSGTITNTSSAEKNVTIKVDFLDNTGKVVVSKEQVVGAIAAGKSGRFNITQTPGKGIAAFRYAKLQ